MCYNQGCMALHGQGYDCTTYPIVKVTGIDVFAGRKH